MAKTIKFTVIICAVAFFSSMTGYVFGANSRTEKINVAEVKNEASPIKEAAVKKNDEVQNAVANEEIAPRCIVKENKGKLAVFFKYSDGSEKLYESYDVSISLLPSSDRELLNEGIKTDSLSEALQIVEDYSS